MKFDAWLKVKGLTEMQAAKLFKKSRSTIVRWKRGERKPDEIEAWNIYKMSDGLVTPNDFYNLPTKEART